MKSFKVSILRHVFVSVSLIALLGLFLTLYYFVFIPQQQDNYNKSAFRLLKEISQNFKDRVEGSDSAANKDKGVLSFQPLTDTDRLKQKLIEGIIDTTVEKKNSGGSASTDLLNNLTDDSVKQKLAGILQPIFGLHSSSFESVVLINADVAQANSKTGNVIYNSGNFSIDDAVNVDSIYKQKAFFIYPVLKDVSIESVDYKLFIFPFRIKEKPFVLGGFISSHDYKVNSQSFPVLPLLLLAVALVIILCSLPFLKVFLIGAQENISVNDVRSIIAMIYIIPFIFIMLVAYAWLNFRAKERTVAAITLLDKQVAENFYAEIDNCLRQLKDYDTTVSTGSINKKADVVLDGTGEMEKADLKDVLMYPQEYKNFDGVFWIDNNGQEIAKWNFIRDSVYFFNKKDRQYFKDIKNHEGYRLPAPFSADTFSIQPTLAKSTGEYTISIATKSKRQFSYISQGKLIDKKAILVGLSGKMYSIFKPVVPIGLYFCIIDASGKILYHSQSQRNLQENIFEECRNNTSLKMAVRNKDSTLLDANLYEKNVQLLIKPLNGLPYYLITYANKRVQFLYLFHIIAFSFLCECLLLLIVSLISLFFYYTNSKFSQLFFSENDMQFTKPSALKEDYYKNIFIYHSFILLLIALLSLLFTGNEWMYFVLNISVQLPLFSVIGYYLIRCIEGNCEIIVTAKLNPAYKRKLFRYLFSNAFFRKSMLKILIPYTIVVLLFQFNKSSLFDAPVTVEITLINILIIFLEICFPLAAIYIKVAGISFIDKLWKTKSETDENAYQHYFLRSILLSAILTSILPTIGLLLYAGNQEKNLQLKGQQAYLSEELQKHREYVNTKTGETKLLQLAAYHRQDVAYIDSLKYSSAKGLYLGNNRLQTSDNWSPKEDSSFNNSSFYQSLTQFLFLPADHPDFFNSRKNYYYWKRENDKSGKGYKLLFNYKNTSDYKDSSHLLITAAVPKTPTTFSLFKNVISSFLLFGVLLFIFIFYKIIFAISKRIFLIGYFEKTPGKEQDSGYINSHYFNGKEITDPFELAFWKTGQLSVELISEKEMEFGENVSQRDESVLKIQTFLTEIYGKIWNDLTHAEQYAIYDFAIDGFTNYKNVDILYSLYKKGLLKKEFQHLALINYSFRNYLITKAGTAEIAKLKREISEGGNWETLRTIFLVLTFVVVVFLFIVQEDVSKRVFAIVTSLGALVPLILKLFEKNVTGGSTANDKK